MASYPLFPPLLQVLPPKEVSSGGILPLITSILVGMPAVGSLAGNSGHCEGCQFIKGSAQELVETIRHNQSQQKNNCLFFCHNQTIEVILLGCNKGSALYLTLNKKGLGLYLPKSAKQKKSLKDCCRTFSNCC